MNEIPDEILENTKLDVYLNQDVRDEKTTDVRTIWRAHITYASH